MNNNIASPLYSRYFQKDHSVSSWGAFRSKEEDFAKPLSKMKVDFSSKIISSSSLPRWMLVVIKIASLLMKIIIFPWGLYELTKYSAQRFVMLNLYPSQNSIVKLFAKNLIGIAGLDKARLEATKMLVSQGYIVRHVVLEKDQNRYSGLLIGHKNTISNGKWALQATGNFEPIEHSVVDFAKIYHGVDCNLLMINGPGVGRSEGVAVPRTMGEAQEVGISFLEESVKAKKLIIAGRSLGSVAVGEAVLQHSFQKNIQYTVLRQMSFDSVSNIAKKIIGSSFPKLKNIAEKLVKWTGCEIDSLKASRRLQELGVTEVVVQASDKVNGQIVIADDGVIPAKASLARRLAKTKVTKNKILYCLGKVDHMLTDSRLLAPETRIF